MSVPDSGGQWQASYTRAAIVIDVVSPDRAWVEQQQSERVRAVRAAAAALQTAIPAAVQVEVDVEPLSTAVQRVEPSRLGQLMGIAALAAVGLLVGSAAAVTVERRATSGRFRGRGRSRPRGGREANG